MKSLNGQQIVDQKIVTKVTNKENIQQVGVDLNVIEISRILGGGCIPTEGKTSLPETETVPLEKWLVPVEKNVWALRPGVYEVKFSQGCNIPKDFYALIRQRSSLLRCGGLLHSSVFDPGFQTENIGTVIVVHALLNIEYNARIAQMYVHSNNDVENLYDGQFQGDAQRKA